MPRLVEAAADSGLLWELGIIRELQALGGPLLERVFVAFTLLGTSEACFLLLVLVLWCVDTGLGARLSGLFFISSWLNAELKDLLALPRPAHFAPELALDPTSGYGMPSGHAQAAVVIWGLLALSTRRLWLRGVCLALMLLIGLSRVYLGAHFPRCVLVGWALGGLLLALYVLLASSITQAASGLPLPWRLRLAVASPLILMLLHPINNTASSMGSLSGVLVGLSLQQRFVPFAPAGPSRQRLLRYALGVLLLVALYTALRWLLPVGGRFEPLIRYLLFGVTWLWATLGIPWLFRRLRLAPDTM